MPAMCQPRPRPHVHTPSLPHSLTRSSTHSCGLLRASSFHWRNSEGKTCSQPASDGLPVRSSACPPWPATPGLTQSYTAVALASPVPRKLFGWSHCRLSCRAHDRRWLFRAAFTSHARLGCWYFSTWTTVFSFICVPVSLFPQHPTTQMQAVWRQGHWPGHCCVLSIGPVGASSHGALHVVRGVDGLAPGLSQQVCTTILAWTGWFFKRQHYFPVSPAVKMQSMPDLLKKRI